MDDLARKPRPQSGSLTAEAYARIRAEILSCRLKPGQKLVIQDICDSLEFSLGAVREALSRLTAEGLVEAEPRRGFRVSPVTEGELRDITMVRISIESQCLERSIRNGDLQWESNIIALLFELSRLNSSVAKPKGLDQSWSDTHKNFHEALVAACDSPWLLRLRETLYSHSERYRWMSHPLDTKKRNIHAEHEAIANAVVARDVKRTHSLMAEHISRTTQIIIDSGIASSTSRR